MWDESGSEQSVAFGVDLMQGMSAIVEPLKGESGRDIARSRRQPKRETCCNTVPEGAGGVAMDEGTCDVKFSRTNQKTSPPTPSSNWAFSTHAE